MDSDLYKTLEAISWELGREPDPALADFAAEATALLAKAQQPDGYLNSYIQVSGRAALRAAGVEPRAVLRRPPDPGRGRGQPDLR